MLQQQNQNVLLSMVFMMNRFILAASLFLSFTANASFLQIDLNEEGDKQVVLDTVSGIEWLRFDNTQSLSYNGVVSELGSSGAFSGWRLPSEMELRAMLERFYETLRPLAWNNNIDHNVETLANAGSSTKVHRERNQIANLFNNTFGAGLKTDASSGGIYQKDNGSFGYFGVYINGTAATLYGMSYSINSSDLDVVYGAQRGTWLVNDGGVSMASLNDPTLNANNPLAPINNVSDVSFPAGFSLIGLALISFLLSRTRVKRSLKFDHA